MHKAFANDGANLIRFQAARCVNAIGTLTDPAVALAKAVMGAVAYVVDASFGPGYGPQQELRKVLGPKIPGTTDFGFPRLPIHMLAAENLAVDEDGPLSGAPPPRHYEPFRLTSVMLDYVLARAGQRQSQAFYASRLAYIRAMLQQVRRRPPAGRRRRRHRRRSHAPLEASDPAPLQVFMFAPVETWLQVFKALHGAALLVRLARFGQRAEVDMELTAKRVVAQVAGGRRKLVSCAGWTRAHVARAHPTAT
jgi:hypothetical protein